MAASALSGTGGAVHDDGTTPITPPAGPRTPWARAAAAVFLLVCVMHGPWLNVPDVAGTEPHRFLPGAEMRATGDWVLPRIFGELYLRKPPGHYWVQAATQTLLGDAAWVYRLPSVLASALTGAWLCWVGARWFGRGGAWGAGLGWACTVAVFGQAQSADIDAVNTLAAALAGVGVAELALGARSGGTRRWAWGACTGVALGAVLLVKFHAGLPTVVGGVIAGAWVTRSGRGVWSAPALLAWALGAVLFGGWAWAAHARIESLGLTFDGRGVYEAKQRGFAFGGLGPVLVTPVILLAQGLPITAGATPWAWRAARQRWHEPGDLAAADTWMRYRLAVVAAGVALVVGVLAGVENARYLYVVLPWFALAAGGAAAAWTQGGVGEHEQARWLNLGGTWAGATAVGAAALAWAVWPDTWPIGLRVGVTAAAAATVVGLVAFGRRGVPIVVAGLVAGAGLLAWSWVGYAADDAEDDRYADAGAAIRAAVLDPAGPPTLDAEPTIYAWFTLWDHPGRLHYATQAGDLAVEPLPYDEDAEHLNYAAVTRAFHDWPAPAWVVLTADEWVKLPGVYRAQLERVTPLPPATLHPLNALPGRPGDTWVAGVVAYNPGRPRAKPSPPAADGTHATDPPPPAITSD